MLDWIDGLPGRVEKWFASRFPIVHADGVSSMIHALIVLGSFLIPGLLIGAFSPYFGLILGGTMGSGVSFFYLRREIRDWKKFNAWFKRGQITKRYWVEKRNDSLRDFGLTIPSFIIGWGVLIERLMEWSPM